MQMPINSPNKLIGTKSYIFKKKKKIANALFKNKNHLRMMVHF